MRLYLGPAPQGLKPSRRTLSARRASLFAHVPHPIVVSCKSKGEDDWENNRAIGRVRHRCWYACGYRRLLPMKAVVEDIQDYALNIVDTVREPLLILDTTLRVRFANRAFCQTFHVSSDETENRLIYELGNGQWDIPALRTLLEDVVPKSSVFNDFELEHTFPVIGRRVMLLNARKLQAGHHGELVVLAMEDVTPRKRAEEALLKAGALQSAIFNSANFSSIATDEKGVIQIFNVGAERMLGYTAGDVMNKITPADISDPQEVITRAKALSA